MQPKEKASAQPLANSKTDSSKHTSHAPSRSQYLGPLISIFGPDVRIAHPGLVELLNNDVLKAMIVSQFVFWTEWKRKRFGRDRYYKTYDDLVVAFPWVCERTIRSKVRELEDLGILIPGGNNRTKWYQVDINQIEEIAKFAGVVAKVAGFRVEEG